MKIFWIYKNILCNDSSVQHTSLSLFLVTLSIMVFGTKVENEKYLIFKVISDSLHGQADFDYRLLILYAYLCIKSLNDHFLWRG